MAFSANRDIRVEASESSPGSYVLRTRGLADRKRPELELAGVPEAALNAAGGVLNMISDYTVNTAEVLADQNVGNVLTVGDEGREMLLVVRADAADPPRGGLWSKLVGGNKGSLRLVDLDGGAPLTALATMLVHRAAVRLAKDDDDGARAELEASITTFPGEEGAGEAPALADVGGVLNWQNHLAYLDLATLSARAGEVDEAGAWFGKALARSASLARRELGTTPERLLGLAAAEIAAEAERIVLHNLAPGAAARTPGPTPLLVTVASPIWSPTGPGEDASAARRASLMPASLVALYYDGPAAEGLRRAGAKLAVAILGALRERPWRAAWIARGVRGAWEADEAPLTEAIGPFHPAQGLVSAVLADVARCFHAGATDDEILARFTTTAPPSLDDKLAALEAWEASEYVDALSS